jgi:di/tricarboxylate transporter
VNTPRWTLWKCVSAVLIIGKYQRRMKMTKDQKVGVAIVVFLVLMFFTVMSISIGLMRASLISASAIALTGLIAMAAGLLSGQLTLKDLAVWNKLKENQDVGDNT